MKKVLFTLTLVAAGASLVHEAAAFNSFSSAQYSYSILGGRVGEAARPPDQPARLAGSVLLSGSDSDGSDTGLSLIDVTKSGGYDVVAGEIGAFAYASAADGQMGVSATAQASGVDYGANLRTSVQAKAKFTDDLIFSSDPNYPSRPITFVGYFKLTGISSAGTFGDENVDVSSAAGVTVYMTGANIVTAGSSSADLTIYSPTAARPVHEKSTTLPPIDIQFTYQTMAGVVYPIVVEMTASAHADGFNKFSNTLAVASAETDFSHTLAWGGITSAFDTATGEPITDWTVASASGFDYSQVIPEPSSYALASAAMGLLALLQSHREPARSKQR